MLRITAITHQKKNPQRFNVDLNNRFAFGVTTENLLKYKLNIGKIITEHDLDKILKDEQTSSLINKSLNFLSYRPRSQWEIEEYLAKKIAKLDGVKFYQARQSSVIERIIKRLKKYKYVDDLEFAKWWLESRTKSKPKGSNAIRLELRRKKIDNEIVEEVLKSFKNQKDLALKSIEKKLYRWRNLQKIEFKRKIYNHLASRGFDSTTIQEIIAFLAEKR